MQTYTVIGLEVGGSFHVAAIVKGIPWIYPTKPYANSATAPWAWQGQAESVSDAVDRARVAFAGWHHLGKEGLIGSQGTVYGTWDESSVHPITGESFTPTASEQPTVKRRWYDPRRYW